MPRDSVDIQRMFTKGRRAIYAEIVPDLTDPNKEEKYNYIMANDSTSTALKNTNGNITVKDKASTIKFTEFGYFGDADAIRIKANSDSISQR